MKITKKNGNVTLYDDEKVITSILKANVETEEKQLTPAVAADIAADVFSRLTAENEIITTQEVRDSLENVLTERGYTDTARRYREHKKH